MGFAPLNPSYALRTGMAKTALYEAMREQGVGRAELARRLRLHLPQVNRVLELCLIVDAARGRNWGCRMG
jgi:hypothetical protein